MKRNLIAALLCLGCTFGLFAQKYAYIDSEYLLSKMPGYTEAQAQLEKLSVDWQNEIEAKFKAIDEMYKK